LAPGVDYVTSGQKTEIVRVPCVAARCYFKKSLNRVPSGNFVGSCGRHREIERENRIDVKIEGALEICGISALAPPRVHGIYLSHTNYRPTHGTIPARSMFEP
jgi:hypothetical protein